MAFDPWASTNQGLQNLGNTITDLGNQQMQRQTMNRQNALADLQMQTGQQALADKQAANQSLMTLYNKPDVASAMVEQAKRTQAAEDQKGDIATVKEMYDLIGKMKDKSGVSPKALTPLIQGLASQLKNPTLRDIYSKLELTDAWGGKTRIPVKDAGSMMHPLTGQPLPPGIYDVEFDANQKPIKVDFVQEFKPDTPEKMQLKEIPSKDGKTAQLYSINTASGDKIPVGEPYAVKSQVTNVNVNAAKPAKALPVALVKDLNSNDDNLRRIEKALNLARNNPDAFGAKNYVPDAVLQRLQPGGVEARGAVGDIGSLIIKDRSGAAVTAAEFPRLRPFIPSMTDDPATVTKKLERFYEVLKEENDAMRSAYEQSGYKVPSYTEPKPPGATNAPDRGTVKRPSKGGGKKPLGAY